MRIETLKIGSKEEEELLRLPHPAGQTSLVERLVCRDELSVAEQGHRQLGCYADLKINSRGRRRRVQL